MRRLAYLQIVFKWLIIIYNLNLGIAYIPLCVSVLITAFIRDLVQAAEGLLIRYDLLQDETNVSQGAVVISLVAEFTK